MNAPLPGNPPLPKRLYLGDGIFGTILPNGRIVLTTEDGAGVTNRIVLEREVYSALVHFVGKALLERGNL
jgi:hypothetical protein